MAKPSKLDRAIAEAKKDHEKALNDCAMKAAVVNALERAKEPADEDDTAPKQKRTRKKKGLPESAADAGK